MIADQCFISEWQARKREELGGCDSVLLEKTIPEAMCLWAEALRLRGVKP